MFHFLPKPKTSATALWQNCYDQNCQGCLEILKIEGIFTSKPQVGRKGREENVGPVDVKDNLQAVKQSTPVL